MPPNTKGQRRWFAALTVARQQIKRELEEKDAEIQSLHEVIANERFEQQLVVESLQEDVELQKELNATWERRYNEQGKGLRAPLNTRLRNVEAQLNGTVLVRLDAGVPEKDVERLRERLENQVSTIEALQEELDKAARKILLQQEEIREQRNIVTRQSSILSSVRTFVAGAQKAIRDVDCIQVTDGYVPRCIDFPRRMVTCMDLISQQLDRLRYRLDGR